MNEVGETPSKAASITIEGELEGIAGDEPMPLGGESLGASVKDESGAALDRPVEWEAQETRFPTGKR